jgi:hypothetical protein
MGINYRTKFLENVHFCCDFFFHLRDVNLWLWGKLFHYGNSLITINISLRLCGCLGNLHKTENNKKKKFKKNLLRLMSSRRNNEEAQHLSSEWWVGYWVECWVARITKLLESLEKLRMPVMFNVHC